MGHNKCACSDRSIRLRLYSMKKAMERNERTMKRNQKIFNSIPNLEQLIKMEL